MADKTGVGNLFDLASVPLRVDSVLDDTDVVDFQPQFVAGCQPPTGQKLILTVFETQVTLRLPSPLSMNSLVIP
jgi:hypothetical protein